MAPESYHGLVAQWTTRLTTDQEIPGSTPGRLGFVSLQIVHIFFNIPHVNAPCIHQTYMKRTRVCGVPDFLTAVRNTTYLISIFVYSCHLRRLQLVVKLFAN